MSRQRPLEGACHCGRNHYAIIIPEDTTERAQVYFDDGRRSQAAPLTAWLRVPLAWYSSSTEAFFPDETHSSIRRIFTPRHDPYCQRVFCGYCGTHLSLWTEQPPSEAEYMNITVGSLLSRDIQSLQDLDLLPEDVEPEQIKGSTEQSTVQAVASQRHEDRPLTQTQQSGRSGGLTWFEEMLDGSRLGRTQTTRRGLGVSSDGSTHVEWEISEYYDDGSGGSESTPTSLGTKRKIGDVGGSDVTMENQ